MKDYSWITNEMFDEKLGEIVEKEPWGNLRDIPGVYEALSEHYNNEVLEALESERQESHE